MKPKNIL